MERPGFEATKYLVHQTVNGYLIMFRGRKGKCSDREDMGIAKVSWHKKSDISPMSLLLKAFSAMELPIYLPFHLLVNCRYMYIIFKVLRNVMNVWQPWQVSVHRGMSNRWDRRRHTSTWKNISFLKGAAQTSTWPLGLWQAIHFYMECVLVLEHAVSASHWNFMQVSYFSFLFT